MSEATCPEDGTPLLEARGSYTTRTRDRTPIELSDVPGWECPECGRFFARGEGIRVRLLEERARELGLDPEEVPILMIMAASAPSKTAEGRVRSRTVFHKMLFRAWDELGRPDEVFGRFNPARWGPMYHDFDRYEEDLQDRSLLSVSEFIPKSNPTRYRASDEGLRIGRELLEIAPERWREVVHTVKDEDYYKSATEIAEEIHESHPTWQKGTS